MKDITRRHMLAASLGLLLGATQEVEARKPTLEVITNATTSQVQLAYEIIPRDPAKRKEDKFDNYSFDRPHGSRLYSPDLSDKRWLKHYDNLEALFGDPVANFLLADVDPLFGMFAERVHPTTLTSRYHHTGVDIFRDVDTEVTAAFDGEIEVTKDKLGGNWIKIKHPISTQDGYQIETRYLHLNSIANAEDTPLKTGDHVEKGQVIGYLGGTGVMDGYFPHLHFEVVMVNPERKAFSIVLDPSRVYFDAPKPDGLAETLSSRFGSYDQDQFRSLTEEIIAHDTTGPLSELLSGLSPDDKRFLHLYQEFWEYSSGKGNGRAANLLDNL